MNTFSSQGQKVAPNLPDSKFDFGHRFPKDGLYLILGSHHVGLYSVFIPLSKACGNWGRDYLRYGVPFEK